MDNIVPGNQAIGDRVPGNPAMDDHVPGHLRMDDQGLTMYLAIERWMAKNLTIKQLKAMYLTS